MKIRLLLPLLLFLSLRGTAQDAKAMLDKVKTKLDQVADYEASGKMKTNVIFLKIPVATVKVYYKKPDKLKIKNEKGVSFIPKGAVNINMGTILNANNYKVLDGGTDKVNGVATKLVILLPNDPAGDLSVATLYIDDANSLIMKSIVTTQSNGRYELEMTYNKYKEYGLPDKLVFSFNTKDYKLPKGVTLDYDDGNNPKPTPEEIEKRKKGKIQINFSNYSINKGVSDTVFQ